MVYDSVFSGPIPVEIVQEVTPNRSGRVFSVRVVSTRRAYKLGDILEANAGDLWDRCKSAGLARTTWIGKTWMDGLEAR